jgi:protein-tyrosine phosphatase
VIDLHCHILPGVDDGPETMAQALQMCRTAAADGIRTIVATSHFKPGCFLWSAAEQRTWIDTLQQEIAAADLPLTILTGAEIAFCPELPALLKNGSHLRINRSNYFLLEFRPQVVPATIERFLTTQIEAGYLPIIAHPERNAWFVHRHDVLTALVRRGALLQITGSSLLGGFGAEARIFSEQLLRSNLVQIIASDAHNMDDRPAQLSRAVTAAAALIGVERATELVTTNPHAVISGARLAPPHTAGYLTPEPDAKASSWVRRLFRSVVS